MTQVRPLGLPEVLEVTPKRIVDARGFFQETWNRTTFEEIGIARDWVQDNHSLSRVPGTLRGLHYQTPPATQAKLVRVTRGAVFDVAVDIRTDSPNRGRWTAVTLSADKGNQIFVPEGFAHGFLTLEPDTEVQYKVSALYAPDHDRAIRWDDPEIGIEWPAPVNLQALSAKDCAAEPLSEHLTGY